MSILKTIKFIYFHPLNNGISCIIKYFKWQIVSRLFPYPMIFPFIGDSKIIIEKGMTGATGNLYCGLHEFEDMAFLLHFLKENDLFGDVGANIGSYTILASSVCKANSISIEPVPNTFDKLVNNVLLNKCHDRCKQLNIGIGSKPDQVYFTTSYDTTNHVTTSGEKDAILVKVETLENLFFEKLPLLLKIDVEGFEMEVIKGAIEIIKNSALKAIIIELNGSGKRYGFNDSEIHQILDQHGFRPFKYLPFKRKLIQLETHKPNGNTLYLRDLDFVYNRILNAEKVNVNKKSF